jgi:hypothetical protein
MEFLCLIAIAGLVTPAILHIATSGDQKTDMPEGATKTNEPTRNLNYFKHKIIYTTYEIVQHVKQKGTYIGLVFFFLKFYIPFSLFIIFLHHRDFQIEHLLIVGAGVLGALTVFTFILSCLKTDSHLTIMLEGRDVDNPQNLEPVFQTIEKLLYAAHYELNKSQSLLHVKKKDKNNCNSTNLTLTQIPPDNSSYDDEIITPYQLVTHLFLADGLFPLIRFLGKHNKNKMIQDNEKVNVLSGNSYFTTDPLTIKLLESNLVQQQVIKLLYLFSQNGTDKIIIKSPFYTEIQVDPESPMPKSWQTQLKAKYNRHRNTIGRYNAQRHCFRKFRSNRRSN